MKPAPFDYYDPRSLDEALGLLRRHGSEARVLAGGQSLVPRLNLRIMTPAVLVDLNHIPDLAYVELRTPTWIEESSRRSPSSNARRSCSCVNRLNAYDWSLSGSRPFSITLKLLFVRVRRS